jgi:3-mercaptopyruvate sulfurtransferase SseA
VTYDDYYGIFAARVAWAFRSYGADSRILDGGWTTWIDDTRALTNKDETPEPRVFTAHPRPRLRRTLDDVEGARAQGATLVDARPRHLFLGQAGIANTGHIPGAHCLPYQELVDGATGLWAAPDAVRRLARDAGIDPDRPPRELIATCGSGVSATVAHEHGGTGHGGTGTDEP